MENINRDKDTEGRQDKNYIGSITYIGTQMKKIIEYLKKYGLDITIKKCKTVYDIIKNNNTEDIPVLQKAGYID